VKQRLRAPADSSELKDLTDFFHAENADILECGTCGLLVRNELEPPPARQYAEDEYDPEVMDRLYPRYVGTFRKKENPYRLLLPEGAYVLEIGSHYGAFLQVAREWGWIAEGVDPGKDTSRFAASKGFTVRNVAAEDAALPDATFSGVFIWNCFEQIEQPQKPLAVCRRALRSGGLLTVRTPNGKFYSLCQQLLHDDSTGTAEKDFLLRVMGYNNLPGFPYLYGYSSETLTRLISASGFRYEGALNSELLTFPLPEDPDWVRQEERDINKGVRLLTNSVLADGSGRLIGPWIELWFRAA
jgi:SAM-dependent methyltransferase